ncbi:MAG: hypothetical protein WBP45_02845 [Daejeonella sp.]
MDAVRNEKLAADTLDAVKTETLAADTLLERGVKVSIPAPLFLRFFGKKNVSAVIRQPKLGTLMRISRLYLKTGITADQLAGIDHENAHQLVAKNGRMMAKIMATALLNGYWRGLLLTGLLAAWLIWKISPQKLCALVYLMVIFSGTQDFFNTIKLVADMKMTSPDLSQRAKRS